MNPLIDRIRNSRKCAVTSGEVKFTIRRPTDLEAHEMSGKIDQRYLLKTFVVGWGEMSEIDLGIPGGTGDIVPFDAELFEVWIADHPEHWPALTSKILGSYSDHRQAREDAAKNSEPGSEEQTSQAAPENRQTVAV